MRLFIVALMATGLIFSACHQQIDVKAKIIFKDNASAIARLYTAEKWSGNSAIVVTVQNPGEDSLWHQTAQKIAAMDYGVLVISLSLLDSIDPSALLPVEEDAAQNPAYTVVGHGKAAEPLLRLAKRDSMAKGLVLINAELNGVFPRLYTKGLPVVCIASMKSEGDRLKSAQRAYKQFPQPKKWVDLYSRRVGPELLNTHVEPIIRRVILMLSNRYLKKN